MKDIHCCEYIGGGASFTTDATGTSLTTGCGAGGGLSGCNRKISPPKRHATTSPAQAEK